MLNEATYLHFVKENFTEHCFFMFFTHVLCPLTIGSEEPSMTKCHTVEIASRVRGNHISGIRVKAYSEAMLGQDSMLDIRSIRSNSLSDYPLSVQ